MLKIQHYSAYLSESSIAHSVFLLYSTMYKDRKSTISDVTKISGADHEHQRIWILGTALVFGEVP